MQKVRVHNFSVSVDGYSAGLNQTLEKPFGDCPSLHDWMFATRMWHEMVGEEGGSEGLDNDFAMQMHTGIGATIMGRNMFGPIRGPWKDEEWKGWWGDNPPYHHPTFVLTHHARAPIAMEGGTTFHFVDDGIESALKQALDAADGSDVLIGGGAHTIQQYLHAGLIDDMHFVIVPVLVGKGERLFDNLDNAIDGYECTELVGSEAVTHCRISRSQK